MKYISWIVALIFLTSCGTEDNSELISTTGLQECPEELIINEQPSIVEDGEEITQTEQYYLLNWERREFDEFDNEYVAANCDVAEQTVY